MSPAASISIAAEVLSALATLPTTTPTVADVAAELRRSPSRIRAELGKLERSGVVEQWTDAGGTRVIDVGPVCLPARAEALSPRPRLVAQARPETAAPLIPGPLGRVRFSVARTVHGQGCMKREVSRGRRRAYPSAIPGA